MFYDIHAQNHVFLSAISATCLLLQLPMLMTSYTSHKSLLKNMIGLCVGTQHLRVYDGFDSCNMTDFPSISLSTNLPELRCLNEAPRFVFPILISLTNSGKLVPSSSPYINFCPVHLATCHALEFFLFLRHLFD